MGMEHFAGDTKIALVCENHLTDINIITNALETLGYRVIVSNSPDDAYKKLKSGHYEVIVLNQDFQTTSKGNSVLEYLNTLPMTLRREILVVLIGKEFKTLDNATAFAHSANLVINVNDLKEIKSILKTSLTYHERFYMSFKRYLKETGRT